MKKLTFLTVCIAGGLSLFAAPPLGTDSILYGAAYYYEYIPYERLDKDVSMMKAAGINTVRLAESTWGLWEPRDGVFDFSKLDHVLDAMDKAGIRVIIGMPTYAIPAWLAREHPEVLVTTPAGKRMYGARQNMDIVSPVFRRYAERIVRQLVLHVKDRKCVIGYQADNETKHYHNSGATMQTRFLQWLKTKFGSPENMCRAYGLHYWSNSIHDWKDFPSMDGNVNASLGCAFAYFQRRMVTEYLAWQAGIIRRLKRPGQFITQNFDMDWRGHSYGIQSDVDHFAAARAFDVAGIDIYHPTGDRLTGAEISFGGDLARSMLRDNYLVMETQAQSMAGRQELPYPGQLRLQAFSHLASGADMIEYWPWQSIPNSVETYWKGVLSHDGEPNPLYEEVKGVGTAFRQTGDRLTNLRIKNKVAILFSNASLTALNWFGFSDSLGYNDILRREYDALYKMNVGCDFVDPSSGNFGDYSLIIVPPLYAASDSLLAKLNDYVRAGGHIVYSCKSGFTDENVQVRPSRQPGGLREACGVSYQMFTNIGRLPLAGDPFHVGATDNEVHDWAELLVPETARVLAWYDHPYWGKYAAITQNRYGKGMVTYIGTLPSKTILDTLLRQAVKEAGVSSPDQELSFPLITKHGINHWGKTIRYYFNYSDAARSFRYPYGAAVNVLTGVKIGAGVTITLQPWDLLVLEEEDLTEGQWLDTDGHSINAHGAGVLSYNGVWYLYGEIKKGPTHLVPGQDWEDYRVDAGGVSCYSSRDLIHWKYEGVALTPVIKDTGSDLHISRVIERPKVIYNASTKKFVMWMHIDREDYSYARAGVAVSDRPEGPYHYVRSMRPDGEMSRDMTVFKDDDERSYLVYTSENNNTMHVSLLTPDYLAPAGVWKRILVGQRREAPAVFKHEGRYFLITSLCTGWDPNPALCATADSMLGEWRPQGNPCKGPDAATTFHSQSTYVLSLQPEQGKFLFMADRWNKTDLEHSGYCQLPLRVRDGVAEISPEDDMVLKDLAVSPLSIVEYKIQLKGTAGSKGTSFLRCYDSAGGLLLKYEAPFTLTDTGGWTGNYIEAPPRIARLTVGVLPSPGVGVRVSGCEVRVIKDPAVRAPAPVCDLPRYMRPFWRSDTIFNETVLLRSDGKTPAHGRLLYKPEKILSVMNFGLDTVYRSGKDYKMEGRTIHRRPGSLMPSRTDSSFDREHNLAWYDLQSQWVTVTYTHRDPWIGPAPGYKGGLLPRTLERLRSGRPVTIVAYGMSITRGMDVSGYDSVRPYMPPYVDLFAQGLEKAYAGSRVILYNAGLPGTTVAWGAQHTEDYVTPLHPDLTVIDFGMNDFWRMPPGEFRDSVRTIIRKIRSADPAAEIILLANMAFDPDYVLDSDKNKRFYVGNMLGYSKVLQEMEGPGIAFLDMYSVSEAIYRRKNGKDCLVNPLHPNDYLARWYAQGLLALLIRENP